MPAQDDRSLLLRWVLPFRSAQDRRAKLVSKPDSIVGSLLGHEGKGSLLSYLKDAGAAATEPHVTTQRGYKRALFVGSMQQHELGSASRFIADTSCNRL
jgi:hypothetical protein